MGDKAKPFGHIEIACAHAEEPVERADRPFRIALLGDFSGAGQQDGAARPVSECRPVLVDRDNYEEIMAQLSPRVHVKVGSGSVAVEFREMDDFAPDRLFRDVALFDEFRGLRRRLMNPATFAQAAAELQPQEQQPAQSPVQPSNSTVARGELLDLVLAQTDAQPAVEDDGANLADQLVKEIVAPYVIPSTDPEQPALLAAVDTAASETMAALLHAPAFQALESAWRSVELLVRRLETGRSLKLYLLDISEQALRSDLNRAEDLAKSGLYRLLVRDTLETPGAESWSLLVGSYLFNPDSEDAQLAGRLAKLAAAAGAPFVASAAASFLGIASLGDAPDADEWSAPSGEGTALWAQVRQLPEARYLGLAAPRFLLRLPYGAGSRAAESFAFEEAPDGLAHEHYLWGCGAVLVAALSLAEQFSRHGWDMQPTAVLSIERLPLHVFKQDGEAQIKPCAEVLLTDTGAAMFATAGIIPLRSVRDADRVLIGSLRSISESGAPLQAPWL